MKKRFLVSALFFAAVLGLAAQAADTAKTAMAAAVPGKPRVLLAYELADKNLDPWRALLKAELESAGYALEEVEAAKLAGIRPADYDLVVVYGAVMAFSMKEPIRDWLRTKPALAGRKVALFVTANRWFLKKYDGQLVDLLEKSGAELVDAVSAATKALDEAGKRRLARDFVAKLPR